MPTPYASTPARGLTTTRTRVLLGVAVVMATLAGCRTPPTGATVAGRWEGTVEVEQVQVPFTFEIEGNGSELAASFFDGDLPVRSSSGAIEGDALRMAFDQYGTTLEARYVDGRLTGTYDRGTRGKPYPFQAVRASEHPVDPGAVVPDIAGEWRVPQQTKKGEQAVRFIARQRGPEVSAAILRVDGDTGALTGRFTGDRFVLSHFSGARPLLVEVTVTPDGTLRLVQNKSTTLTAYRVTDERATALPEPTDPEAHTRAKDPGAAFTFSFPDLDGHVVSNTDDRFRGKVLAISMTGSWCPNCHDEAPFLTELFQTYRAQGLEVIAFAFEEEAQLRNPVRLKAFIRKFGIAYPVLLAGVPDQLAEKVPQAENLNAFPTTIFVGRDGRIRSIHAGFASAAAGEFHEKGKAAVRAVVERLLAEKATTTN